MFRSFPMLFCVWACVTIFWTDQEIAFGGEKARSANYLSFIGRNSVELQETQGMIDLNAEFTVETWVRWDPEAAPGQYIIGDEAWPGMSPKLKVDQTGGWVLRTTPLQAD